MRRIILVNAVNVLLLAVLVAAYIIMNTPPMFIIIFIIWIIYVGAINYQMLVKDTDTLAALKSADKKRLFTHEIDVLIKAVQSIEFYRNIFEKYEVGNSIRDAYDLLAKTAYHNVNKATLWIQHYDYITRPPTSQLQKMVNESQDVTVKLNQLDELILQIDSDSENTDLSAIDDMLNSLKEVIHDE